MRRETMRVLGMSAVIMVALCLFGGCRPQKEDVEPSVEGAKKPASQLGAGPRIVRPQPPGRRAVPPQYARYQQGPRSLLAICEMLGVGTSLNELARLAGPGNAPRTMEGISEAASKKGLAVVRKRMLVEELRRQKRPTIVRSNDNRFLVVERFEKGKFRVLDPPQAPSLMSGEELAKLWGGEALLISKRKRGEAPRGPDAVFAEYTEDFGECKEGEKVERSFRFRNVGDEDLVISRVKTSCRCTAILPSSRETPPGGSASIKLTFNSRRRKGKQSVTAFVSTNDPFERTISLKLTGTVDVDVNVMPSRVRFGIARKGQGAERIVTVASTKIDLLEVTGLETRLRSVSASVSGRDPSGRVLVKVTLAADAPLGRISDMLVIKTNLPAPHQSTVRVPIRGQVRGRVDVLPQQLYFTDSQVGTLTRMLTLRSGTEKPFRILSVKPSSDDITTEVEERVAGKEYRITVTWNRREDSPTSELLRIQTDDLDEPELVVPIKYRVLRQSRVLRRGLDDK